MHEKWILSFQGTDSESDEDYIAQESEDSADSDSPLSDDNFSDESSESDDDVPQPDHGAGGDNIRGGAGGRARGRGSGTLF